MNNYVLVRVVGKNINNYIKWLIKNKINVVKLKIIKHNELNIIIDNCSFNDLLKYSKTYDVSIVKRYGYLKIVDIILRNKIILFCLAVAILFICFLSNYIFSVEIIYNDVEVVELLKKELAKYDIEKYKRKKSYKYLLDVKDKILANNKDILEWLEIEENGTKYIVKLVERKKETKKLEYQYQSVVAKKDATISNIKTYSGERVKLVNEYVRQGDVVISGIITKPNGEIFYTKATGTVLGEVWYKIQIEYPLFYREEKLTGNNREVLTINLFGISWPVFPYRKYKHFNKTSKVLIQDNFGLFMISKEKIYEAMVNEAIYTGDEAIIKAKDEAIKKLKESKPAIIDIKNVQVLNKWNNNSMIRLDLFIAAIEDITEIVEVKEQQEMVEN